MKMLKRWIAFCLVMILLAGVAFDHSSLIGSQVEAADLTEPEAEEQTAETVSAEPQAAGGGDTTESVSTEQQSAGVGDTSGSVSTEQQSADSGETSGSVSTELQSADVGDTSGSVSTESQTATEDNAQAAAPEVKHQDAMELKQEIKDADGTVICTVTANIEEGTFDANTEEVSMKVSGIDQTLTDEITKLAKKKLDSDKELGSMFLYKVEFQVNGTTAEPGKEVKITFQPKDFQIDDTKKATVFYYNEANSPAGNTEAEIVEIIQKQEQIEALQAAGQSTENIDKDYDLTEISLKADGMAEKIVTEGRRSTVYGCYLEEDKPEEVNKEKAETEKEDKLTTLHFENDDVTITVSEIEDGAIPEGAELKVVPLVNTEITDEMTAKEKEKITEINKEYETVEETLENDLGSEKTLQGFVAFDISLLVDGDEVEPASNVKVSIEFKNAELPEGVEKEADVSVKHLEKEELDEAYSVEDLTEKAEIQKDEESNAVQKMELVADSFSPYVFEYTAAPMAYNRVETIDSAADGIVINLFDYQATDSGTEAVNGPAYGNEAINDGRRLKFFSGRTGIRKNQQTINIKTDGEGKGIINPGMVDSELGNDGYPVLGGTIQSNVSESLSYLFDSNNIPGAKVSYTGLNHLFVDQDGYYYYNSDEYYAYLKYNNGTFEKNFSVSRGNELGFFPFTDISHSDSNAGARQNGVLNSTDVNHYFGMTISTGFLQPKNGEVNGEDMIFEFSGDDDVWVFIDDKLVLDLGGIHGKVSGTINFATGEVTTTDLDGDQKQTKSLKEIFNLEGNSFDNYTTHTMKFFYMERGNDASNCKIKFNLQTIPEDTVEVAKIVETENGKPVNYSEDIDFLFNIEVDGDIWAQKAYTVWKNGEQVGETQYTDANGNFTLKHGETARFSGITATAQYEVKELGAYLDGYEIQINDTTATVTTEDGEKIAASGPLSVDTNGYIEFKNIIKDTADLKITKQIKSGSEGTLGNSEFKIQVKINGELYDQTYEVSSLLPTPSTAENGIIVLKNGETATIRGIPYGASVEIEEVKGSSYYPNYSLTGDGYDTVIPEYDQNGFVSNNVSNKVFTKLAGDCEVTIENREVKGGTTNVVVNKQWSGVKEEDQQPVEITLYEGEEGTGSPVVRSDNPLTLNEGNDWQGTWNDLPGDTNYYVVESVDGEFEYTTSYSYNYEVNSDFVTITPCSDTYYPLGSNGIVAVKGGNNWIVWTSEPVAGDEAKTNLIGAINKKNIQGNSLSINNTTFISGTTTGTLQGGEITFEYSDGNLLLDFNKSSNWSFFAIGTYTKTITATVVNSIDQDAIIDIPVQKQWEGDPSDYQNYNSVTVELYKNNQATGQTLEITKTNDWIGSFTGLPYYTIDSITENYTVNKYSVKEIKVDNVDIANMDRMVVSVTGDSESGFIITNSIPAAWYIRKVSSTDEHPLAGATFTLTRENENEPCYYGKSMDQEASGRIYWWDDPSKVGNISNSLDYIPDGVYILKETKAPEGYKKSEETWTIRIEDLKLSSITSSKNGPVEKEDSDTLALISYDVYQFKNDAVFALPQSGGPGIYWYLFGGVLLMMTASLIVYKNKRREVLKR